MRTLLKVGLGLLLLSFILIAMSFNILRAKGITSSGSSAGRNVATEVRQLSKTSIDTIDLSGPIDLTLRQGAVASLTVRGEERLLKNIDTVVEGDVLHIGIKGMMLHHRHPLQVVLTLPSISKVSINGSGDSTINGFSGERVEVLLHGSGNVKFNGRYKDVAAAVNGSGDLELNGGMSEKVDVSLVGSGRMTVVGSCKEFKVEQSGSGDLDAEHLAADTAAVNLHGSGTSLVQARKVAEVTLRGSGDVSVIGNPTQRNVNKTGSGDVTFQE